MRATHELAHRNDLDLTTIKLFAQSQKERYVSESCVQFLNSQDFDANRCSQLTTKNLILK